VSRHQKKVAIIVDNPRRDLRGLVLLAVKLRELGIKVFLVPMYLQGYEIPLLKPNLVIVNYARTANKEQLENYRKLGIHIAVLDTEGGIFSENSFDSPHNHANHYVSSGLNSVVDYYLFWGERFYEAFVKHKVLADEDMAITGCPRYDLCYPPWNHLLKPVLKTDSDYILFNMNFSAINPEFTRDGSKEKLSFVSQGWDSRYVDQLFTELSAVWPMYISVIKDCAKSFPGQNFLVRPHPFESQTPYKKHFRGVPNIFVNGDGDVFDAISGAAVVLHLNCGSAVDALMMGKPAVSLEFLNTPFLRAHTPLPSKVSRKTVSFDDLKFQIRYLDRDISGPVISEEVESKIKEWFGPLDGSSINRVVEFLIRKFDELQQIRPKTRWFDVWLALKGSRNRPRFSSFCIGVSSIILGSALVSLIMNRILTKRRKKSFSAKEVAEVLKIVNGLNVPKLMAARNAAGKTGITKLSAVEIVEK